MASTASDIISHARSLLRADDGSDVPAIGDEFMLKALSDANMEWARAFRRGGGTQPIVFMREGGFSIASDTQVNEASGILTTDTEFTVDSSTSFDSSGVVAVWTDGMADLIPYTGNSSNTFTGVTQIGFAHDDNDTVQKLYKLTGLTSFGRLRASEEYGDGVQVDGTPYYFREATPDRQYFTIYDDGTDKWLWLPKGLTGTIAVLYEKASATINDLADTVDVPTEFDFFLIWRLVQFGTFGRQDSLENHALAKAEANKVLNEALSDRNIGKGVQARRIQRRQTHVITASEIGL
jgi:hypothetical protein